jgi:hypothetical protein
MGPGRAAKMMLLKNNVTNAISFFHLDQSYRPLTFGLRTVSASLSFAYKGVVRVFVGWLWYQDSFDSLQSGMVSNGDGMQPLGKGRRALYWTLFNRLESMSTCELAESSLIRYSVPASAASSLVSMIPNGIVAGVCSTEFYQVLILHTSVSQVSRKTG